MSTETSKLDILLQDVPPEAVEKTKQKAALEEIYAVYTIHESSKDLTPEQQEFQRNRRDTVSRVVTEARQKLHDAQASAQKNTELLNDFQEKENNSTFFDRIKAFSPDQQKLLIAADKEFRAVVLNLSVLDDLPANFKEWDVNERDALHEIGLQKDLLNLFAPESSINPSLIQKLKDSWSRRSRLPDLLESIRQKKQSYIREKAPEAVTQFFQACFETYSKIKQPKTSREHPDISSLKQLRNLDEILRETLEKTDATPGLGDLQVLRKLSERVTKDVQRNTTFLQERSGDSEAAANSTVYDAVSRIESAIIHNQEKFTAETHAFFKTQIADLMAQYQVILGTLPPPEHIQRRLTDIQKALEKKLWKRVSIGSPLRIREVIYTQYKRKLEVGSKKEAQEWLKIALDSLKDVAEKETRSFLAAWDELWGYLMVSNREITAPTWEQIDSVFFKHDCSFNAQALNIPEVLNGLAAAHNESVTVLTKLGRRERDIFEAALPSSIARAPHGNIRLDTSLPCIAVKIICENEADYHLLVEKSEPSDTSPAMGLGVAYIQRQTFRVGVNEYQAPLIVINQDGHKNTDLAATLRHEVAHRKFRYDEKSENKPTTENLPVINKNQGLSETRQRSQDHKIFDTTQQTEPEQSDWQRSLQKDFTNGLLSLRDEVQAFVEENDYSFETIEEVLLAKGTDAFYEYVASDAWKQRQEKMLRAQGIDASRIDQVLLPLLEADTLAARAAYEQTAREALRNARRITNLFPQNIEGRKKAAALLRFSTLKEWRQLTKYLTP